MGFASFLTAPLTYRSRVRAAKKADAADQKALDVSQKFAADYTAATSAAIGADNKATLDQQNYNNSRATTLQNYLADSYRTSMLDTRRSSADSLGAYKTSLANGISKYRADNATSVAGMRDTYGKTADDLQKTYDAAGQSLESRYAGAIGDAKSSSAANINEVQGKYDAAVSSLADQYKNAIAEMKSQFGVSTGGISAGYDAAVKELNARYASSISELKTSAAASMAPLQKAADGYMARSQVEDPSLHLAHDVTLARTAEAGDANKTASANLWAKRGNESRSRGEAMMADIATEKGIADENAAYGVKDMAMRSDNRDKGNAIINQLASMGVNVNQLVAGMQTEGARAATTMQTEGARLVADKQAELAQLVAQKQAEGAALGTGMTTEAAKLIADKKAQLDGLVAGLQSEGAKANASLSTEGAQLIASKRAELAQLVAAKEAAGSSLSVQMELEGAKLIADKKDELEKIIAGMRTDGTKAVADVYDKNTSSNIAMVLANALRNTQLNLGGVAQSGGTLQDAQRIRADSVGANAAAQAAALSDMLAGLNGNIESAAKMYLSGGVVK